MLSKIRSLFARKSALEKNAAAVWDGGVFPVNHLTPRLGVAWDPGYFPYWREWAKNPRKTVYQKSYTSVDDLEFWVNISQRFTAKEEFGYALFDAAGRGNLSVFKALPQEHVQVYAKQYLDLVHTNRTNNIVHPNTVAFMREQGYWNQEDVHALAKTYRFVNAQTSSIKSIDPRGVYQHPDFVLDWCAKSLQDNNWSAEDQAQFIGNFMITTGGDFWVKGGRELLGPLLHPEVDVSILAAICGLQLDAFYPSCENESVAQIYQSIRQGASHFSRSIWPHTGGTVHNTSTHLSIDGGHAGMNILMDLTPPETPIDFYRMGVMVKSRELGLGTIETIALPNL